MPGFFSKIFGKKCPTCKQKGFLKLVDSQMMSTEPGYATVTRQKQVKNAAGVVIRTEEWQEQVHVVRTAMRETYLCSGCNTKSSWVRTREDEG